MNNYYVLAVNLTFNRHIINYIQISNYEILVYNHERICLATKYHIICNNDIDITLNTKLFLSLKIVSCILIFHKQIMILFSSWKYTLLSNE